MFDNLHIIANLIATALASFFALDSLVHLFAPGVLSRVYREGGYSKSFLYSAATVAAITAGLLLVPQTRIWGGILGAMILFSITTSLLFRERYVLAIPIMVLLAAIPPAMV